MRLNWNGIRKRVEALEEDAAIRSNDGRSAELLSPCGAAFLLAERQRLTDEATSEAMILAERIDELLASHDRALRYHRPKPLSPAEAHEALVAAMEAEDEDGDDEKLRQVWHARLRAMSQE